MRWNVIIWYRTAKGLNGVEHDVEELAEIEAMVERGPDWRAIDRIEITLQRFDQKLTVEEAAQL